MPSQNLLPIKAEYLKKILRYDPLTGEWTRLIDRGSFRAGSAAGCLRIDGYIRLNVSGRQYYSQRLAWLYMTGEWPEQIDHKNGIRSDNRWSNLREATSQKNNQNKKIMSNNRSGYKGIKKRRDGKWIAQIKVSGKILYLGTFNNPKEAHAAYAMAAVKHFGEFANTGRHAC